MNPDLLRLLLRITARISFVLFLGAFVGQSLWNVWPTEWTEQIRCKRPQFLLGFAGSHTIHLGLVFALALNNLQRFRATHPIAILMLGGILYALIYGLAAAAFIDWKSRGQQRIAVLHSTGFQAAAMYAIWSIFALALVAGTFRKPLIYAVFGLAAVAAPIMRLVGRRSRNPELAVAATRG